MTPFTSPDLAALHTVRDWVRCYVSEMTRARIHFGHGCANALDEAVFMVQCALALPVQESTWMEFFWDARVTDAEKKRLLDFLLQRVQERKPSPYITGEAWLQGVRFEVDARAIVPRSYIAELLADQLTPWVQSPEHISEVLDMCTGSGCLAILAAMAFENAKVDAVDISPEALALAQHNISLHNLQQRVSTVKSNLFDQLPHKQYNLLVCNPPYVNNRSMATLPPEYLHEPRLALAGGEVGMDFIERILQSACVHLHDDGFLVLELGNEREHFETQYPDLNPVWLETSAGHNQVLLVHKADLASFTQTT
jgi:ribosomal protein L3 glutamine methyltransferase